MRGQGQLVRGNRNWNTRIEGTTPDYSSMRNQVPVMGRFFTAEENQSRQRVAVIGQTVMKELFGEEKPRGPDDKGEPDQLPGNRRPPHVRIQRVP